jgi:hypothetical protein
MKTIIRLIRRFIERAKLPTRNPGTGSKPPIRIEIRVTQ